MYVLMKHYLIVRMSSLSWGSEVYHDVKHADGATWTWGYRRA